MCRNLKEVELTKGEVDLGVGNGARVVALAIGTYHLSLPTGLIIELEYCYFVLTISRSIICVSCLDKKGFSFLIKHNNYSIYLNELFYGSAQLIKGSFLIKDVMRANSILKV